MTPEKEAVQSYEQMLIVEKYETVIAYLARHQLPRLPHLATLQAIAQALGAGRQTQDRPLPA